MQNAFREDGFWCPASTWNCLGRHSCPADRGPNSSSLFAICRRSGRRCLHAASLLRFATSQQMLLHCYKLQIGCVLGAGKSIHGFCVKCKTKMQSFCIFLKRMTLKTFFGRNLIKPIDNMGMREYNAGNKTTRLVGKWEFRKGGYSNDADLEKSSARQLSLRANVQRPGRETNSEP